MSFSYYGELCTEVYDLTKKIGQSFSGDVEFYQDRLKDCKGNILEAMAARATYSIRIAAFGNTLVRR